jgi:hypothetical protein
VETTGTAGAIRAAGLYCPKKGEDYPVPFIPVPQQESAGSQRLLMEGSIKPGIVRSGKMSNEKNGIIAGGKN